jgi:hypothetical protein
MASGKWNDKVCEDVVMKETPRAEEYTPERSAILEWVIGLLGSERVLNRPLVIEDDERVNRATLIPGDPWSSDFCFALLVVEGFFATTGK